MNNIHSPTFLLNKEVSCSKKKRKRNRRKPSKFKRMILKERKERKLIEGTGHSFFIVSRPKDSILLNRKSFLDCNILAETQSILKDTDNWHAFVLTDVPTIKKQPLLKIMMDFLKPVDLIPVQFQRIKKTCMFVANQCEEAVVKICRHNFEIPSSGIPIKCDIILRYRTQKKLPFLNIKTRFFKQLRSTLDAMDAETLNLEYFTERDMPEYWPLSQPKILYMVLDYLKQFGQTYVKLNNNDITSLLPLEALWASKVTKLDLRNNLIDSISQLETLKWLDLTELWLSGNPMCDECDEFTYTKKILHILPKLKMLDGVSVETRICPPFRRNFLCNRQGFEVVDQFLEFYYPLYDSNRDLLDGLYNRNSLFSFTASYIDEQVTSESANLSFYEDNNRNLMQITDSERRKELLYRGAPNIIKKLRRLPKTEHDPFSFTVDLLYHKENVSVISISGVFREVNNQTSGNINRLCGFKRTFVVSSSDGEYTIANDLLHVNNALTCQEKRAFKVRKPLGTTFIALTDNDKERAIEAIQMVTGLSIEWSKRLLADSKNDVVQCLKTFISKFKVDQYPIEAFKR